MLFMLINFGVLLLNNMIFKQEKYSKTQKQMCVVFFTVVMMYMTSIAV